MLGRKQYTDIITNLAIKNDKMAFLVGPRQVGKTTLAQQFSPKKDQTYYTWDDIHFRKKWTQEPGLLVSEQVGRKQWIIFDELHKAPKWKSTLKGIYDLKKDYANILVTGSARMDTYRKGGDSLLGRYFAFRIHPFSLGELDEMPPLSPQELPKALAKPIGSLPKDYKNLLQFGGFPDPFLKKNEDFHRAWLLSRQQRVLKEDIIDFTRIREISIIETLMVLLPSRIGSPLSIQALAEDIEANFPSTKRWIEALAQLYYIYLIHPYSKNISRSLKKQPKAYFWDWSQIEDKGARFENMIASHLLKACHFWTDTGKGHFELFYIRDKEKREVDFLITQNKKPWLICEAKLSDSRPHEALLEYAKKLDPEIILQVVGEPSIHESITVQPQSKGYVISADMFLGLLP